MGQDLINKHVDIVETGAIDNFCLIGALLKDAEPDKFYFIQIMQRKKEHPELGSNSRVVKTYYVTSLEALFRLRIEIITTCQVFNARAYINLNRRSFKSIAFQTLKKMSDQILNESYKDVKNAYDSSCGSYSAESTHKTWIIDIDGPDCEARADEIRKLLIGLDPIGDKLVAYITTKNGMHIICKPFNRHQSAEWLVEDVHRDNPTILYCPSNSNPTP